MSGWNCWCWSRNVCDKAGFPQQRRPFSLPAPIPHWSPSPQGEQGFGNGTISIGELQVAQIANFQIIWCCTNSIASATFYKPVDIPDGFFCLGHYGQSNDKPLDGFVLVAREIGQNPDQPALLKPLDYRLIWRNGNMVGRDDGGEESCCIWLPCPPEGYKSMGYLVTSKSDEKPSLEEVRCVRSDLTDTCETNSLILDIHTESMASDLCRLSVWTTRPSLRGMWEKGIPVGTFFCNSSGTTTTTEYDLEIACLKNINLSLKSMPNMNQIHELIKIYGPTVFFHSEEVYFPSSVSWLFKNGALLYKKGEAVGVPIVDSNGSNLPGGGFNDGEYWIDLPNDDTRDSVMQGDLQSAELYVHIKPALGGTYTDIAMWVFCPFNGPATLKLGAVDLPLSMIGQHVGDWEHFTLRVSNFTGQLWRIYFSQHSSGEWIDVCDLEYIEGNKAIVYSSKNGHASFAHPGNYLQGSTKLGIGIRNDAERSQFFVDSSVSYSIVAAEYLGDAVNEPCWLQYMREWGPKIVYNSKIELDKIINLLPAIIRSWFQKIVDKLPLELYGEEGPTGPKEKNMWAGDERG